MGASYSKPDHVPHWADGEGSVVAEPSDEKKDLGWDFEEVPPRSWMNWLQRYYGFWFAFLNERMADDETGGGETYQQFVIKEPRNGYPVMRFTCKNGTTTSYALPPGDGVKLSSLGSSGDYWWDHVWGKSVHAQNVYDAGKPHWEGDLGADVDTGSGDVNVTPQEGAGAGGLALATSPSQRITVAKAGQYLINATFMFHPEGDVVAKGQFEVKVNGVSASPISEATSVADNDSITQCTLNFVVTCAAAGYIEFWAIDSGNTYHVQANSMVAITGVALTEL